MRARGGARAAGHLASALLPLLAAFGVWAPILDNFFHADDFLHLFNIATMDWWRFVTQLWGGHLLLVRNAVFMASVEAFGPDPRPFFWTVLLTHGANTVLLYLAIRRFTGDWILACAGALLWTTGPVLEGTLGWYSVYGQVLLTTLVLAVLSDLGALLARDTVLSARRAATWGVLLAAGAACFGTGLGVVAVFPLAVLTVVPAARRSRGAIVVLVLAAATVLTLYVLLRALFPGLEPQAREVLAPSATLRAFPLTPLLFVHLVMFGASALLAGLAGLEPGYPDPSTVLPAAIVGAITVAGWLVTSRAGRRRLGALALLVVVAYVATALGRVSVADLFGGGIAMATLPRYHYFPLAVLALLLSVAAAGLRDRGRLAGRLVYAGSALGLVARAATLVIHPLAIDHHPSDRAFTGETLARIRAAVAAVPPGEIARIEAHPFRPVVLVVHISSAFFPGSAGAFAIFFPANTLDGRPVRFLVSDADWLRAQTRGGRIAALVERR